MGVRGWATELRKLSTADEVAEAGVECEAIAETVEVFSSRDASQRPVHNTCAILPIAFYRTKS